VPPAPVSTGPAWSLGALHPHTDADRGGKSFNRLPPAAFGRRLDATPPGIARLDIPAASGEKPSGKKPGGQQKRHGCDGEKELPRRALATPGPWGRHRGRSSGQSDAKDALAQVAAGRQDGFPQRALQQLVNVAFFSHGTSRGRSAPASIQRSTGQEATIRDSRGTQARKVVQLLL
jgi:hypothetical protein